MVLLVCSLMSCALGHEDICWVSLECLWCWMLAFPMPVPGLLWRWDSHSSHCVWMGHWETEDPCWGVGSRTACEMTPQIQLHFPLSQQTLVTNHTFKDKSINNLKDGNWAPFLSTAPTGCTPRHVALIAPHVWCVLSIRWVSWIDLFSD